MGDWDNDWESGAVTITKAENTFAKEDKVDLEALEKQAKEEAKKKQEEENKKKKEEEEAAKKKKGPAGKKIPFNDQFEIPDNSSKLTHLKEKKNEKEGVNELFDGANHKFNENLDQIELKDDEDFKVLGSLLGNKLCDPEYFLVHVEDFFKTLLESTYDKFSSKELQELSTKATFLLQKKQKEEKQGGKKTKSKAPTLAGSKSKKGKVSGSDSDDDGGYNYKANFNEDDFI